MNARVMRALLFAAIVASIPSSIPAQSSATYKLTEHVFNGGGRPDQGVVSSSSSFRLSLDSIGEIFAGDTLSGVSYRVEGGAIPGCRPPGEVDGLEILADGQTLTWSWEPASTAFNVYSGMLSTLPGGYGTCAVSRVADTTWGDPSVPDPGDCVFYLVTGENRLLEEGTKGHASIGTERANLSPCP